MRYIIVALTLWAGSAWGFSDLDSLSKEFENTFCTSTAYRGSEPIVFALPAEISDIHQLYSLAAKQVEQENAYKGDLSKRFDESVLSNLDMGRVEEDDASRLCANLIRQHRDDLKGLVEFREIIEEDYSDRRVPHLILITKRNFAMVLLSR